MNNKGYECIVTDGDITRVFYIADEALSNTQAFLEEIASKVEKKVEEVNIKDISFAVYVTLKTNLNDTNINAVLPDSSEINKETATTIH